MTPLPYCMTLQQHDTATPDTTIWHISVAHSVTYEAELDLPAARAIARRAGSVQQVSPAKPAAHMELVDDDNEVDDDGEAPGGVPNAVQISESEAEQSSSSVWAGHTEAQLAEFWCATEDATGKACYWNKKTKAAQWARPNSVVAPATPAAKRAPAARQRPVR